MRVTWYTAASLDGRIAGTGDDLGFLDQIEATDGDAHDFDRFIAGVDAVIVGGGTMRWLEREGHSLPLRGKPIWVVSTDSELAVRAGAVDPDGTPVTPAEGDLTSVLQQIEAEGFKHLWICGGADIAGQILAIDRLDELI